MHKILALAGMILLASISNADPIAWPKPANERAKLEAGGTLVVAGDTGKTTTQLLLLEKPKVPSHQYRLVGKIKYENVQGEGHVEMWNKFAGRGDFFTKTLDATGPLRIITGTSDWREIHLPFNSEPNLLPERLTVNLVLPGTGKVWLTPMTLENTPPMGK